MTIRNAVLFDGRRVAHALRSQWAAKGALQPLPSPLVDVLEQDLSATRQFRGLWPKAFPTRDPLPYGPLANKDGTGSDRFLDVFA